MKKSIIGSTEYEARMHNDQKDRHSAGTFLVRRGHTDKPRLHGYYGPMYRGSQPISLTDLHSSIYLIQSEDLLVSVDEVGRYLLQHSG